MIPDLFEVFMIISFGISWPVSIIKSYRSRTTKGKSFLFLCLIFLGYACGIVSKLTASQINFVIIFYFINFLMVFIDILLYLRNRKIEQQIS